MVHIEKLYFTLKEIAKRWDVRKCDLAYMAENGILRLSVRVHGVHLERGQIEVEQGRTFLVPGERIRYTGLLELTDQDAFLVFRSGECCVEQFHVSDPDYAMLIEPKQAVTVRPEHLLVKRCERDRIEALHAISGHTIAEGIGFQHSADYRTVRLGSVEMTLGVVQAKVIRLLHHAALSDSPWCDGKRVLSEAGATSMRMSDVLKSQRQWRKLIRSDGRGRYRLRLKPE